MNYDNILSERVLTIPPSGIRKFFDIVATMKDAISLGVGEPDFTTPWNVCRAGIKGIEAGETHYTSNWGTIELRRAIARYLSERGQAAYDPKDEIFVTCGASEGIDVALRALINPGDEVLVPEPSYVSYMPCVTLAGGICVPVRCTADNGFALRPDLLREKLSHKTKALILPYPNNPTGGVMTRAELEEIADVLRHTDVVVVSDEIYSELVYGGHEHTTFASLPGMRERTVTLNGFSKAFAMTGWRLGYVAAPRELIASMVKIHQYVIMCAPTAGQIAATEALTDGFENDFAEVARMLAIYDTRRRIMLKAFAAMGLECFEPKGAFYTFPSVHSTGLSSQEFCEKLLEEQKVACVPGGAFGPSGEGHIRCCYATATDKIVEAMRRMAVFVAARRA